MRFFNPVILMLAAGHKVSTTPTTDAVTDVIDVRASTRPILFWRL